MELDCFVFPLMTVIPVWFILYSLFRIRLHWWDGKERRKKFSFTFLLKLVLLLLLSLFAVLKSYSIFNYNLLETLFYISLSISLILSIILLIFEFFLKLRMTWAGHRIFWVSIFLLWCVLFIYNYDSHNKKLLDFIPVSGLTFHIINMLTSCVLSIFALFKPNEFQDSAKIFSKSFSSVKESCIERKNYIDRISIVIGGYKIKGSSKGQYPEYKINVKIEKSVNVVKRSYKDFIDLNDSLKKIFPLSKYPCLVLPSFPSFSNPTQPLEDRIDSLNTYLSNLRRIDFFIEETLDFLGIDGEIREKIVNMRREMLETVSIENESSINTSYVRFESETLTDFRDSCRLSAVMTNNFKVRVLIKKFAKKNSYVIQVNTPAGYYEVIKSFKEICELHKKLIKNIGKNVVPFFPNMSFYKLPSVHDSRGDELKRNKLEKYFNYVFNDPVFHTKFLFDFIDFNKDFHSLWQDYGITYQVLGPIEWETDVSLQEFVFVIDIEKKGGGLQARWKTKRLYKHFAHLQDRLVARNNTKNLRLYYEYLHQNISTSWPVLPSKIQDLSGDIQKFTEDLESYLQCVLSTPLVYDAYVIKKFLREIAIR